MVSDYCRALIIREGWIMAKKIDGYVRLEVPAGAANPSPPVGPALGQAGLNIMEFCKAFNAATQDLEANAPIPTTITVYQDKSFSFITIKPVALDCVFAERKIIYSCLCGRRMVVTWGPPRRR